MRLLSVLYQQDFLTPREADYWLRLLQSSAEIVWGSESFSIFGRKVIAPRQLAWLGDMGLNYRYTGLDHLGKGWPTFLSPLKAQVETLAAQNFNFLLLNRYRNGQEYMGWHRDDESGCDTTIASLSLGASRRFRFEHASTGTRESIELEHGSLMIFDGRQKHCLSKTLKPVGERVNLTFRLITA